MSDKPASLSLLDNRSMHVGGTSNLSTIRNHNKARMQEAASSIVVLARSKNLAEVRRKKVKVIHIHDRQHH